MEDGNATNGDGDIIENGNDDVEEINYGRIFMLHTACSSPCPFSVVKLCLELYPE
jgi:hypothetical protein